MTPEQQEQERQLMIERIGDNHHPFKVYRGEIKEIDLTATWYCPHCVEREEPLSLNSDGLGLHCTAHYEHCDYEYRNKAGRDNCRVAWFDGYKYPITQKERLQKLVAQGEKRLKDLKAAVKAKNANLKELQARLNELEEGVK